MGKGAGSQGGGRGLTLPLHQWPWPCVLPAVTTSVLPRWSPFVFPVLQQYLLNLFPKLNCFLKSVWFLFSYLALNLIEHPNSVQSLLGTEISVAEFPPVQVNLPHPSLAHLCWSSPPHLPPPVVRRTVLLVTPNTALFFTSPRLPSPTLLKSDSRKTRHLSICGSIEEKEGVVFLWFVLYLGNRQQKLKRMICA